MIKDAAFERAEEQIRVAKKMGFTYVRLGPYPGGDLLLDEVPDSILELDQMAGLSLEGNSLTTLPKFFGQLTKLELLHLGTTYGGNPLVVVPACIRKLKNLRHLRLAQCSLAKLPDWLGELKGLKQLDLDANFLADLPESLADLTYLVDLDLANNPLNPELAAAYEEGLDAVKRYLRAKTSSQVELREAKLILIGEGEVGKSCLLGALRGDPWEDGRPTTHGIEIKPVEVADPVTGAAITLNGWDFGGQRVYRPTHQLFFGAPAIYLVVWKPREGPQQGLVNDWIKLVKHREPDAKIFVVATHGGPRERQPDIDRQEIWDLFGREMIRDFFLVDSRPNAEDGERKGITDLKEAIARVASELPEMGRRVPSRWVQARREFNDKPVAYLPVNDVLGRCGELGMEGQEARDFLRISHRLGHLIYYEHDPALRDIVVLKPDWLAVAISFVLDDKQTRDEHGLVTFARLSHLWNDPTRPEESRYDPALHPLFLRLMERFDLSYKVAIPGEPESAVDFWQRVGGSLGIGGKPARVTFELRYTSLVAQLVPDIRPDRIPGWPAGPINGDSQQRQICQIAEARTNRSAPAEGLFFQLIVRLHKYSLGRVDHVRSVHWQRGLLLEDNYGARALLEHVGNDVRITVRSPYPERFLAALTYEVKWLVESFWTGLRCDVMVPCLNPRPCIGLFEVSKLIENKKRGRPEHPCAVCNEWQDIEVLLHNAPASRPSPLPELLADVGETMRVLSEVRQQLTLQQAEIVGRFDELDASSKQIVTKVEAAYSGLMHTLVDEGKDGPRLFSFQPVAPDFFDRPKWVSEKFLVTLWCEHSRLPLPAIYGKGDRRGVYELNLSREWVGKAAPFLKVLASTLSLVVPIAASVTKLALDEASYKGIEEQLEFGEKSLDSVMKAGGQAGSWLAHSDADHFEGREALSAQGSVLRQLQAWLKEKDPSFGGLVRVQNKRQEFLWVHPQFEKEY